MSKIRLAKFIADSGHCSRRQASRLIDQGNVLVNNKLANHIDHVDLTDKVFIHGEPLHIQTEKYYYAINKPIGVDCKLIKEKPDSLIHLLPDSTRLYPIGRLDKDSHGLLLLTNDGELCHQLNHPDYIKEKEYRVTTCKTIDADFCHKMMTGVPVKGQITRPCTVKQLSDRQFMIILSQGLNRQIRRMTQFCGNHVTDLQRIRIASLTLSQLNLAPGEICKIKKEDIIS